jgi:hypothetical protein
MVYVEKFVGFYLAVGSDRLLQRRDLKLTFFSSSSRLSSS